MTISKANFNTLSKYDLSKVCTGKHEATLAKYFKAFVPQNAEKPGGFFPGFIAKKSRLNPNISKEKKDSDLMWIAKMGIVKKAANDFSLQGTSLIHPYQEYHYLINILSYLEKVAS